MTTARRLGELADDRQRAVEIQEIVVRKLLAVKLMGRDQIRTRRAGPGVESPALVRILAVAQRRLAAEHQWQIAAGKS